MWQDPTSALILVSTLAGWCSVLRSCILQNDKIDSACSLLFVSEFSSGESKHKPWHHVDSRSSWEGICLYFLHIGILFHVSCLGQASQRCMALPLSVIGISGAFLESALKHEARSSNSRMKCHLRTDLPHPKPAIASPILFKLYQVWYFRH
jgi:hypothetical protein